MTPDDYGFAWESLHLKLYSVGYNRIDPDRLRALLRHLDVGMLVDVRSIPSSRRSGFSQAQLGRTFSEYRWAGKELGGRPPGVTAEGLRLLMRFLRTQNVMIMCMEDAPGDCHRHHTIAVPLLAQGIDCVHVFGDHLIRASELQRAINYNVEYASEPLSM